MYLYIISIHLYNIAIDFKLNKQNIKTKYQMCIFILGHRPNHITKIFSNLQSYATAQQKNKFANYVHLYLIFFDIINVING